MKKLLASFAFVAAACLSVFAEEGDGYRRTWDFTKGWSESTLQKLENDPDHWEVQGTGFQNKVAMTQGTMVVYVNGEPEVVPETEGLEIMNLNSAKHLQVFSTNFGTTFPQVQCLWINGKNSNDIVKFKVPAGENVRIGYCSHKNGEARGFTTKYLADENGNKTFKDADATVIHEVTLINNQTEEITEELKSTSGHHIYYIIIGAGDAQEDFDPSSIRVGYVYPGGDIDEDLIYNNYVMSYESTPIDITTTEAGIDSLASFDVLVYSSALTPETKGAAALVDLDEKVPVLNLSAALYEVWGWATVGTAEVSPLVVDEDYMDSPIFEGTNASDGELVLFESGTVATFAAPETSFIADDAYLAASANGAALHTHGLTRNLYVLIPCPADNESLSTITDDCSQLINNAITGLYETKSKLTATPKPTISQTYYNGLTTVAVTCANKAAVVYVNGSVYEAPFDVTEDGYVVEAYAIAHGYLQSATVTATISVQSQLAAPSITQEGGEGFTTLTISPVEGGDIYYTFSGVTDKAQAALYTEPVVVREPGTIYAFAASNTALPSELVSLDFTVGGIPAVKDTVAHFNAGEEDWFTNAVLTVGEETATVPEAVAAGTFGASGSAKAVYYFGKSAWNYYSTEIDHEETVTGSEGQDSIVYYYKPDPAALKTITSTTDTQWIMKSRGQVVTGETSTKDCAPIKGVGNTTPGRYADEAIDEIGSMPTPGFIDFGGKTSGEPYTLSFETTGKYQGDFDIVTYIGNGSTGSPVIALQTSTDGENWQTTDTLNVTTKQRYYKKTRVHLTLTDESYLRVTQLGGSSKGYIYDIYVITTEGTTGIETISADREATRESVIFDLQGRQIAAPVRGHLYIQNGKKYLVK